MTSIVSAPTMNETYGSPVTEPIVAYWPLSDAVRDNWGDKLNPILIEMMSGRLVVNEKLAGSLGDRRSFMVIGSGLHNARSRHVVWGMGFLRFHDNVSLQGELRAVRGPLSRQKILAAGGNCPEVYGDPALLMPIFYFPRVDVKYDIGIIQHCREIGSVPTPFIPEGINAKIINITGMITDVVDDILSCRQIVSSSLHGLIAAHAYGVPATWIKFSDRPLGDGFKFKDYWASMGVSAIEPIVITPHTSCADLLGELQESTTIVDFESLIDACPFIDPERARALKVRASAVMRGTPVARFLARQTATPTRRGRSIAIGAEPAQRSDRARTAQRTAARIKSKSGYIPATPVIRHFDEDTPYFTSADISEFEIAHRRNEDEMIRHLRDQESIIDSSDANRSISSINNPIVGSDVWLKIVSLIKSSGRGKSRNYSHESFSKILSEHIDVEKFHSYFIDITRGSTGNAQNLIEPGDLDRDFSSLFFIFSTFRPSQVIDIPADFPGVSDLGGGGEAAEYVRRACHLLSQVRSDDLIPEYERLILRDGSFRIENMPGQAAQDIRASFFLQVAADRPFVFYLVAGSEVSFLISHPRSGKLDAVYFAEKNVLVGYDAKKNYGSALTATFRSVACLYGKETAAYIHSTDTKRVAPICGSMRHWGHTILNEYDGFQKLADDGLLSNVNAVLVGRSQFVRYEFMYPELKEKYRVSYQDIYSGYKNVIENNLFVVRLTTGNYSMSLATATRMVDASRKQTKRKMAAEYERATGCYPLVWFEVRSNDRIWIGQAKGIARVANKLRETFPKLGIIVAGWSQLADDPDDKADLQMIAADQAIFDEITAYLNPDISVFNAIGMETSEKIIWSLIPDTFVTVFSSGILYPLGLGRIAGVMHSNTGFHGRYSKGSVSMIEDCPKIFPVHRSEIIDMPDFKSYFDQNHDVDWSVIYRLVIKALGKDVQEKMDALRSAENFTSVEELKQRK